MKTRHSLNRPATQKDLEEWGDVFNERFENLENSFEALKKNTEEIKDKMMTGFDKVMKRLDDIDTNLTLNMHDTEELKEKVTALKN